MSDWLAGYTMGMIIGIGAGFAIGFAVGKKQKLWSKLTEKEKKIRILITCAGAALAVLGVVVFFLLMP